MEFILYLHLSKYSPQKVTLITVLIFVAFFLSIAWRFSSFIFFQFSYNLKFLTVMEILLLFIKFHISLALGDWDFFSQNCLPEIIDKMCSQLNYSSNKCHLLL